MTTWWHNYYTDLALTDWSSSSRSQHHGLCCWMIVISFSNTLAAASVPFRRMSNPILMSPFLPFLHHCQAWINFASQAQPPPRRGRLETHFLMTPFLSNPILMSPFPPFLHHCQAWINFASQAQPPLRSWRLETHSMMTPFLSNPILMSPFAPFLHHCQARISFTSQAYPPPKYVTHS